MISNLRDFDNFLFESSSVSLMDNIYLSIKQSIKVKLVMPNQTYQLSTCIYRYQSTVLDKYSLFVLFCLHCGSCGKSR